MPEETHTVTQDSDSLEKSASELAYELFYSLVQELEGVDETSVAALREAIEADDGFDSGTILSTLCPEAMEQDSDQEDAHDQTFESPSI